MSFEQSALRSADFFELLLLDRSYVTVHALHSLSDVIS